MPVSEMIMPEAAEAEFSFVNSYSSLLTTVWTDEEEAAKLTEDPTAYARAQGLPVQPGAVVRVDRARREGLLYQNEIIADWTAVAGEHILHVPAAPVVDPSELRDPEPQVVRADTVIIILAYV